MVVVPPHPSSPTGGEEAHGGSRWASLSPLWGEGQGEGGARGYDKAQQRTAPGRGGSGNRARLGAGGRGPVRMRPGRRSVKAHL